MLKNTKNIFFQIFLYSCPIRVVPTYILPVKERRLFEKFQPGSFKIERQVSVEMDGQMDRRTWLDRLV